MSRNCTTWRHIRVGKVLGAGFGKRAVRSLHMRRLATYGPVHSVISRIKMFSAVFIIHTPNWLGRMECPHKFAWDKRCINDWVMSDTWPCSQLFRRRWSNCTDRDKWRCTWHVTCCNSNLATKCLKEARLSLHRYFDLNCFNLRMIIHGDLLFESLISIRFVNPILINDWSPSTFASNRFVSSSIY